MSPATCIPQRLPAVEVQDVVHQTLSPTTDVLFVYGGPDASAVAEALTRNAPFFRGYQAAYETDWQVGMAVVTEEGTTLTVDPGTGEPSVLESQALDYDAGMPGLDVIDWALQPAQGFRRPGAALHVLIVADADDTSALDVDMFLGGLTTGTGRIDARISGVLPGDTAVYRELVYATGGDTWAPGADWPVVMDALGLAATGLERAFPPTTWPDADTLFVQLSALDRYDDRYRNVIDFERAVYDGDGNLLNERPVRTWDLDVAQNSVRFLRFVPEPGSQVIVRYDPRDASP